MIPTPEEQATQEKLDLTQGFAVKRSPEQAAVTLKSAKLNGVPFEVQEAADKDAPPASGPSWSALTRAAPVLAQTLTDPALAAAVHDDVPNLQGWEKLFGGWRDMAWATANEWQRGSLNVEVGALGRQMLDAAQGRGTWTPESQARLDDLNKQIESIPEAKLGFFTGVPAMAAQSLPIMIRGMKNAGRETSVGAAAGLVAGAAGGAAVGGVGAIPGAAAGLLTGAGMGFTAGTARGAGEDEAGLAMVEFSQTPGVDLKTAAAAATVVGVVNGTLEILPLEKVLKVVPAFKTWVAKEPARDLMRKIIRSETGKAAVARLAGRLAEGGLLEGITEFAQEVTTITAGQVAGVAPETTFAKALDRAWGAGVGGAQGGLGFGAWHSTGEFRADLAAARAAKNRQGFYEALGGLATDSKMRERLPEEQRAYLDKLIEKYGAAESIEVPAEKLTALFQKEGWSEEDIRTKLPGVAAQLSEAAGDPKAEVSILTPDFAQHIAPTSGYTSLHQDLRVGDEPTLREAVEIDKKAEEILKDFDKLKPDENPVFADLYTKLQAAGFSEQVTNRYASLWTAFVENRAKRQGVDPKAYYEGLGLTLSHADLVEAVIPSEQVPTLSPQMLALRERALQGDRDAMDQLEAEFSKDELTGARGQNAWKRFVAQSPAGVFLAIDANDLKRVNDTLGGHAAGDIFLKAISDAIMPAVQAQKGKFFRAGGDEFTAHFKDRASADAAVQAITEAMNALPALFEGKHKASISMGLGMTPAQADLASGKAKEPARAKGRSGFGRPGSVSKVDLSGGDVFFRADETPAPTPVQEALKQKIEVTETPAFKKWFKKSKVVDEDGKPKIVYHGTTHGGFDTFSNDRGNPENYFGRAFYFSDHTGDVGANYAGEGPDLTSRIENLTEQLAQEKEFEQEKEKGDRLDVEEQYKIWEWAKKEARVRLAGDAASIMPVYLSMQNPLIMDPRNGTRFEVEFFTDKYGNEDERGPGVDLMRAVRDVALKYGVNFEKVWGPISEIIHDEPTAFEVDKAIRENEELLDLRDDNGAILSYEFIRDVWLELGFDGIIQDAYNTFGAGAGKNMKIPEGTLHYIVFKPNQIKSAIGNRGTFSTRSKNILFQPAYHGTPHRGITAFSLGKIGTGEGAQAYGWGLYFAEKKGIAEDYRKRLSGSMVYLDGKLPETEDDKAIVSILKANGYGDGSPLSFKAAREKAVQYLKNLIMKEQETVSAYEPFAKGADPSGAVIPERRGHYQEMVDRSKDLISKYEKRIERLNEVKHAAVADSYALPLEETVAALRERAQRRIDEIKNSEEWRASEKYADLYDEFGILDEQKDPRRVEVGKEMSRLEKIMPSNEEYTKIENTIRKMERIVGMDPKDFWDLTQIISVGGETSFGEAIKGFEKRTGVHTADLVTPPAGQTYKVDLPEKSELLDYDKPLKDQPEIVKKLAQSKALLDAIPTSAGIKWNEESLSSTTMTGEQLYKKLSAALGSDKAASKALFDAGIDGLIYLDGTSRKKEKGTHNFVIWNESAVKIMEELYQKGAAKTSEDYRGKIEFDDTRKWFNMTLTGKANLSTFLHESGHAFLEIMRRDAMNGDAQSAQDLAIVEKWMAEGETDRTAQLEKFARGFEAYLYEGKAPSSELVGAFAAFKTWLRFVYSAFKSLKVDLTDEVRGVMDRLIASDEEIQKARERTGLFAALGPTELEPAQLRAFQERYERAVQAKQEEMERDALSELRRALKDAQTKIRDEVEALARKDKAFNAAEFLRTGKTLDPEVTIAPEAGRKLSRKTIHEYVEEGDKRRIKLEAMVSDEGMDADGLAPYLGYGSGQELVTALLDSPSRAKWIKEQVDARMAEKYPESTIASLSEKAVAKLHEGSIDAVLEAELDAFEKKTGSAPAPRARDVLRLAAKRRVEGMTAQEMQPGKELRAEERAAREVLEAVSKKDYALARDARRRQMWHRFMFREMTKAKEEVAKIRDYLHTFEELPTRKRVGKAGERYIEAIDAILEAIDLSKQSDTALARRASLETYLQEMEAEGEPVAIPPELRAELGLKNWRQMTLDEMRGIQAAVENIEALARLKKKLFDGRERRDFIETTTKLGEHIRANVGVNFVDGIGGKSGWEKTKTWLRYARANMSKIEFICRVLDGGKTAGWAHELLFQPLAEAQSRKYKMTKEITEELRKPFREMSLKDRLRFDKTVDFLGQKLKYREVIALILNLGNEGNKEKLIKGFAPWGFTEQNVMDRLHEMYRKGEILDSDLDLVQHIWTTIDKLWPEIRALSQRNVGLAPPKVEATPLRIGGRTLEGGYYPVVYNRDLSHKGEQIAQRKTGDLFENNFLLPSVEKGFTESRTKFFAPIALSLDVIPDHINEVIHYITHYEAVRAVDRLTSSKVVKEAITDGMGREVYQLFRPWLQAIAADGTVHESTKWYDAILRRLRLGSSIALLGFKVTTGLKQTFGLATSAKEIGRYTLTGAKIFAENVFTGKGWGEISELSTEFKETERTMDRDIGAMFRSLEGSFSLYGEMKDKIAHFALAWLMLNQRAVNAVTWYGAREKAMAEGHPDPVAYANSVMRMTQAGGGVKDLAAVQRGSEMERTMTVMYTYFSVLFNQVTEAMPQKSGGQKVAILAARWWWLVTLPVLLDAMASAGVPDDDKDKEKYLEALTYGQALYFGRSVPLAGEALSAFVQDRDVRYGAWIGTLLRGARSAGEAARGQATKTDIRNMTDLFGAATGFPAGAAKNAFEFASKYTSGSMEEPVQNLLFRSPADFK